MTCLIMQEIGKLDVRISVIPNGLEKYKSFTINKNLFFIDNMQYMNSMVMLYISLYIDEFNIYIYIYIYIYILRICQIMILSIYHNNLVVNC